jgi:AcrR family transcriptional regulator
MERTPDERSDRQSIRSHVRGLLMGYRVSQMLIVAAKLGIADTLAQGPRSVDDLARSCGAHPGALYRLLRSLASLGVFRELDLRRFELTPSAELLRSDAPDSIYHAAVTLGEPWWWEAWGHAVEAVRTGQPAFEQIHGKGVFEFLAEHPDIAARFNSHMGVTTDLEARTIVERCDFVRSRRIVDLGGGHGALLQAILVAHPHVEGILYDLPAAIAGAVHRFEQAKCLDRCTLIGGDFLKWVPVGADTYVLKNILHDWDDERAGTILRNCRRAIREDGRLLVIESVLPEANEPSPGKIVDMTMLVIVGGAERTEAEYRSLLRESRFDVTRIMTATSGLNIIEAVPA